jgi:hypothetical protein
MKRNIVVVTLALGVLGAAPVNAQRALTFGVAGGLTVPQGNLNRSVNTGWHLEGSVALGSLMQPLGVRAEVALHRFGFETPVLGSSAHHMTSSLTVNGTYRLPMTNSAWSPYLIAGLGPYHVQCSPEVTCFKATRFGWNGGAGVKLYVMGLQAFVEARFHDVSGGPEFFPVTLGVLF